MLSARSRISRACVSHILQHKLAHGFREEASRRCSRGRHSMKEKRFFFTQRNVLFTKKKLIPKDTGFHHFSIYLPEEMKMTSSERDLWTPT